VSTVEPSGPNQPFVAGEDRPRVQLHPDTPISELTVRDLSDLLGGATDLKKIERKELIKEDLKQEKIEKFEHKEKPEKFEHKEKPEKFEHKEKPEKIEHKEKPEKIEHKEKPEKIEHKEKPEKIEQVKETIKSENPKLEIAEPGKLSIDGPPPVEGPGDPAIDELIASVSQLKQDVARLQEDR